MYTPLQSKRENESSRGSSLQPRFARKQIQNKKPQHGDELKRAKLAKNIGKP
jgi:hypothetical protein